MSVRPKILAVDDNPANLLSIRTVLKGLDMELHEAGNGFDALSMSLAEDYALILLDGLMPDMDGFEVCEQLRANPRTVETPVIFLTEAYKNVEDNIRGYVAGATDYLAKPIDDHVLKAKVQVFLRLYRQQRALQKANEELRIAAIAFDSQEGIVVTDAHSIILRINRAFTELTGYSQDEAVGRTPSLLKSGHHDEVFYQGLWQALLRDNYWQGEIWNRRKNGEIYPEWLTITAVLNPAGQTSHYVGVFSDITQRKAAEEQILQLAFYDPLTQLPNRRLLMDRLGQAKLASTRSHCYGAILFIDLDQFKQLNDTRGHDVGDLLLIEVAQRLRNCVREIDTVARLGGDEFMVILEDLGQEAGLAAAHARAVGEKILASTKQPYSLNGYIHHTTASIGISLFHNSDANVEALLKYADTAMYEAKSAGRDTLRFFDPAMQLALEARAALETDLRQALQRGQLQLYYQAQVDSERHILGAEALLRWEHPQHGVLLPEQFIPLAEDSGLIGGIGLWVLETACRQLLEWGSRMALPAGFQLAVNVSASQFRHPRFVEQIREVLEATGADPRRLKLELTESVLLADLKDAGGKMARLKKLGLGFSLDDFGTGYSSLAYLKQLPLDQLKIDRIFVGDIEQDDNSAILVQTIIGMSQNLQLHTIAEGVESQAQLDYLLQHGCLAFQGFLFSHPLPAPDFSALLAGNAGQQ
jgi:diguanylate cyclase (GGDEF)-like protein/PAS domain S-box-containing protein